LGADLGGAPDAGLSQIVRTRDARLADDPLLNGVRDAVPARLWFDLVRPKRGARVLAWYQLHLAPGAAQRLKNAGFPSESFGQVGGATLRFPALVAFRDGDSSRGELRSLYFGGEASGYGAMSESVRRFPALSGIDQALSGRFGAYGAQNYWGYYEPVLRNALSGAQRLRWTAGTKRSGK